MPVIHKCSEGKERKVVSDVIARWYIRAYMKSKALTTQLKMLRPTKAIFIALADINNITVVGDHNKSDQ